MAALALPAGALALPDGRGYEMVTPLDKNAQEVGPGITGTAPNSGNAVNWEALGGCCGATSAASTLYQSTRTSSGWVTTPKTPTPPTPLVGLFEEQQPMWWSPDLSKTIYLTPSSYTANDARPPGPGETVFFDLYEQSAVGALTWLTGPFPNAMDTNQDNATWAATTPDGNTTLFDSQEQLTSDATPLASLNTPAEYLYARNIANGTTTLVNVTTTKLAAAATGQFSTSLAANAVGTTPTTLTNPVSPPLNDNLTAAATGAHSTTLTSAATGNLSTTLTAATAVGATDLPVVSSAGFAAGQTITVDAGSAVQETTTVTSVPDATDVDVTALVNAHASGASVNYGGDTVINVASTTGFAAGQLITIDTGGSQESATIASVPNSTQIDLASGLINSHALGAAVSYAGDTTITVTNTSLLEPGETITIDPGQPSQETAVISGIPSSTQLQLSAPLAHDHASGAVVTYPGDTALTVASSGNFSPGQTITIDTGASQETATIASVPDATHIDLTAFVNLPHASGATVQHASPDSSITVASTGGFVPGQTITIGSGGSAETATISAVTDATHLALSAPLANNHSSGDPVSYGGDTTLTVASTSAFSPGQVATIGTGATQETDKIASVPDSTHLSLSTPLVNNHASGDQVEALVSTDGAIAGNGNFLNEPSLPANDLGTTTNSISSQGTKVFFESPPTCIGGSCSAEGVGPPHLYMRDLAASTTTPLDNPAGSGQAVYEGASQDGSLVFFSSNEGLGGDSNTDNELYAFNTTGAQIGPAAPMSVTPISDGGNPSTDGNVVGITAISNDGSEVWFVAKGVLASNTGAQGETATSGDDNFYAYNTTTGATTFIAQLNSGVPSDTRDKTVLTAEPDTSRAAIPTPNGSVLVFESTANLTNQNGSGPTTTLTADTNSATNDQPVSIPVASSAGFLVGRTVEIVSSFFSESATILGIPDSTHLLVTDGGIGLFFPHSSGDQVVQRPPFEIYRYVTASNSLTCVSCTPAGVTATGSAGLGASGGGSYGPPGEGVPMSSDGSRIFFDSPDPLAPGVISSPPIPLGLFGALVFVQNVYEWQNGTVSVISDGHSTTGSALGSTTPSGNDVFFTTEDQLVPQDTDGYDDIYDARVGGGFPAPPTPTPPCTSAEACRSSIAPTVFFPAPSSATLVEPSGLSPSFSVNSISARQRRRLASTGVLTLTVHVTQAGRIVAVASDPGKRMRLVVASASHSFFATHGGTAKLTLHLSKAARTRLAKQHRLSLVITVTYSESSEVYIASLTLTKGHTKKATTRRAASSRRATVRRGARER